MTDVCRLKSFSAFNLPVFAAWLKLLSFRPPTSVTSPILIAFAEAAGEPPPVPLVPPPHAATIVAASRPNARTRFMNSSSSPAPRRGRRVSNDDDSRRVSDEHAPEDVAKKHDVQAAAEHERGQRQRVFPRPEAKLDEDEQGAQQGEHRRHGSELSQLPGCEQHADRDR